MNFAPGRGNHGSSEYIGLLAQINRVGSRRLPFRYNTPGNRC